MNPAEVVLLSVAGAGVIVIAIASALRSTILPRSANAGLARTALWATRFVFRLRAGRSSSYARRDRVMAMLGPIALLVMLASWLALTIVGFTLLYLATGTRPVRTAFELSGSSVFTLGTTASRGLGTDVLSYLEAGIGLLLVTLLITYLPSIYGAFSRRENGVNLLRVRAGDPPRAATLLIRYQLIGDGSARLGPLWQAWEAWFTDVEETHTTFAVLAFFRSPQPEQSWITAAGTLLDAASLWVAAVEHSPDADAQLCIRTGFQALRRIAFTFGLDIEGDPAPDDPISIGRKEWDDAVDDMQSRGVPVLGDRDAAWKAWAGWRVNYDAVLLTLARFVEAPPGAMGLRPEPHRHGSVPPAVPTPIPVPGETRARARARTALRALCTPARAGPVSRPGTSRAAR